MRSNWAVQRDWNLVELEPEKVLRKVTIKRKAWFLGLIPYWYTKEIMI